MNEPQDLEPVSRMPVGFVSHGAPTLALDQVKGRDLSRWAASMPAPRALLVISAHWEATPIAIGTARPRRLIYDFAGFDPRLDELEYAAPGAPWLAAHVKEMLPEAVERAERMWDHGVWVPLVHMFPRADTPLLQLSLPSRLEPEDLFAIGQRLRPLRDQGVLVLASGGMVHNLGRIDWSGTEGVAEWATSFEAWARQALVARDLDQLLDMRSNAPNLAMAHPTLEHILPLIVAFGTADEQDRVAFPVSGFEYGSLSRTAVQFG